MSDNRVYVVKNLSRKPSRNPKTGKIGTKVETYLTRTDDNGIPHPVGFAKDQAVMMAKVMKTDPEEAVILCPDDLVVTLDDSARKLPKGGQPALQQMTEGITSM